MGMHDTQNDLILTQPEIKDITGYSRPAYQKRFLDKLGIAATIRPDNTLLVFRASILAPQAAGKQRPMLKSERGKIR
jgi:hypothetical protein